MPTPFRHQIPDPRAVLEGATVYDGHAPAAGGADGGLTERRLDILRRASRGESHKQIARALGVTERTVKLRLFRQPVRARAYIDLAVQRLGDSSE